MQVVAGGCPPLKGRECVGIHRRETASQGGSRRITPVLVKDGCFCFLSLRRCEREKGNDAMALRARRERHGHGRSKQKIFIPALRLRGRKRKMKKNILKKITAFAAAAALIVCTLLFAGCQNEGKIRISIAQIADHPSLDTIRGQHCKNACGKRL